MKQNKANTTPVLDELVLACPICQNYYLHQGDIEYFGRNEDATDGTFVRLTNTDAHLISGNRNPSIRRQGLTIGFYCEYCGNIPYRLAVYQDKGNTCIEWMKEEQ